MRLLQLKKIEREEAILSSLKMLDYLTRDQIQRLHQLGGDRNARRVLENMGELLHSFRGEDGQNIYFLSKEGRERIACEIVRQKSSQVGHYLMRNDMYIRLRPDEWKNEMKFIVKDICTVIPDAYFKHQQRLHFLEIDHLQKMYKNHEKIEKYRQLKDTGVFQERHKYFPPLIWVTVAESRKRQLEKWCEGLSAKVYTWDEIK